ncbi:Fic family protein [Fulvivirgaceae bacterium BMA12]|uniref:Fic family protein n=1 Tax=Agaribacillus aureus TaxID=3051825 RepID=A0ABT8LI49_9BACT|nr:Fic family protein [Fulvivirgaceae bacterium BMA12]
MTYNWQQPDWPEFTYRLDEVEALLFEFAERTGRISGFLQGLPEAAKTETIIAVMVAEAVKTSEIEGEFLSREDVMSSIKNHMGLATDSVPVKDKRAQGIAALMMDVRNTYAEPLTSEKLFSWHRMLMKGNSYIKSGAWRSHEAPMQVISGTIGKEKVHYEASPSKQVPQEMVHFIQWFNATEPGAPEAINKPAVRSAIAHLYFESIHPFEDGNGRIGRAISEKALSQGLKRPVLLSLSQAIEQKKMDYYNALKRSQKSNEITPWITYFVQTILESQTLAETRIDFTLKKTKFFDRFNSQLNARQLKVISRMLQEGPDGFEGGMSAKKYGAIAKTSKATATRDLQELAALHIFIPQGGGRSTRYTLSLE